MSIEFPRLLVPLLLVWVTMQGAWGSASAANDPAQPLPRARLNVKRLTCEDGTSPLLGVDSTKPRLGWQLESAGFDQRQTAFQVIVASSIERLSPGKADLWDSGKVESSQSTHLEYGGKPLRSMQGCHWKVRVWSGLGISSDWSPPAYWEMGLLQPGEWRGRWIGAGPDHEPRGAKGFFRSTNDLSSSGVVVKHDGRSLLLRKSFQVQAPVRRARVLVTGLGYYELRCNATKVGQSVLAPAKSNYAEWIYYDTYDVTECLHPGENVLGLVLGNGWFNPYPKWWDVYRMLWFGSKRALVQLHIEFADGTTSLVVSDDSWQIAAGPTLSSCVYDGELYDATQEESHWDRASGKSDIGWRSAVVMQSPGGKLKSQLMPSIQVVEERQPVSVTEPKPGMFVFDFGQNFAGWARFLGKAPRGTRVQLRYTEDLYPDGTLDFTSNERAKATDIFVMKGIGEEAYEPKFTFHGFRYVEVTGFPAKLRPKNLVGCVVHSACAKQGNFECDNELLNRIHRATVWAQRSNLMGYPMDCPQRAERLGWLGDAMVSMEEAMFNFEMRQFYTQWLEGLQLNQNRENGDISIISPRPYVPDEPDPTWSSAYLIMVWHYYVYYGDRQFLEHHFEGMRRYVDYLGRQARDFLLPKYWIGDWGTIVEGWKEGEPVSVGTAFYYYDALVVSKAAAALGRSAETREYGALADQIKTAFNRRFFREANYDGGTQFANAFPLCLGLAAPQDQPQLMQNILLDLERRQGHLSVGVLGAKYLLEALTLNGRADAAYELATKTTYPSWGHMLEGGRTTLSEFWDLHGSHNHVMLGSIDGWFYKTLAGIQPDEKLPGFEHFVVDPFIPAGLNRVRARVETIRGNLTVSWEKKKNALSVKVRVPVNSTATVHVPTLSIHGARCVPPRTPLEWVNGKSVYHIGSGDYEFKAFYSN